LANDINSVQNDGAAFTSALGNDAQAIQSDLATLVQDVASGV
jgi:hypothetical protein